MEKISNVSCGVLFYFLIKLNQKILILSRFVTKNDFSYVIMTTFVALPSCIVKRGRAIKTINIKQYLSTSRFLVDNKYFVIKSSQGTQLYFTKILNPSSDAS
jgi:hypothetical protein